MDSSSIGNINQINFELHESSHIAVVYIFIHVRILINAGKTDSAAM